MAKETADWSTCLGVVRAEVAGVLNLDGDGLAGEDNLFDLGLHSLTAVELASRLSRNAGLRVGVRTLFDCPTIGQLAAALQAQRRGA